MNLRWKTFKIVASMKKWSTRKSCVFTISLHRYITCSIPVSGWRATSSGWRATSKKSTWKNRVKFKYTCREVQVLHAVHFRQSVSRKRQNEWSHRFRNYLKTAENQRKPSTWKSFAFSVAFQRYIIRIIPIKFVQNTAKICFLPFLNLLKTVRNWDK